MALKCYSACSTRGAIAGVGRLPRVRVISWNVAGRTGVRLDGQIQGITNSAADVIALQEVTRATQGHWRDALLSSGCSVLTTIDLLAIPYPGTIRRRYCNLLATRHPVSALLGLSFADPEQAAVAFPEKHLAAIVVVDGTPIEVHNTHLPPGSTRGVIKPHAFEAIRRRVDESTSHRQILCGDFNTPRSEGESFVETWGRRRKGDQQPEMWDAAERSILEHPRLRDVYRATRTHGEPWAHSHVTRSGPKRYDHIYAGPGLEPLGCSYGSRWLEGGLSDHAAVQAELRIVDFPDASA